MHAPPSALSAMGSRIPPHAFEGPARPCAPAPAADPAPQASARSGMSLEALLSPAGAQGGPAASGGAAGATGAVGAPLRMRMRGTDAAQRVRRICAINVQAAAQAVVWTHPVGSRQRETATLHQTHALRCLEHGLTAAFVAQHMAMTPAIVVAYLEGRFRGEQDAVEKRLQRLHELYVCGALDAALARSGRSGLSKPDARTKDIIARERQWEQSVIASVETRFAQLQGPLNAVTLRAVSLAALSVERVEGAHIKNEAERAHFARARQFRQQLHMIQQQKIIMQQQESLIREQDQMLRQLAPPQQQVVLNKPFLRAA